MREKYESLSVAVLRDLAKARSIPRISTMKKSELVDAMLRQDELDAAQKQGEEARMGAAQEKKAEMHPAAMQEKKAEPRPAATQEKKAEPRPDTEKARERKNPGQRQRRNLSADRDRSSGYERSRLQEPERAERSRMSEPEHAERSRMSEPERAERSRMSEPERAERSRMSEPERAERSRMSEPERAERSRIQEPERAERSRIQEPERTERGRISEPERTERSRTQEPERAPAELAALDSGRQASGILEVMQDGYGFLRGENYLSSENDIYVAPSQIRKFNLKTGDIVTGNTRMRSQQEKYSALLYIQSINGFAPSEAVRRYQFEDMTPIFPNERLRMERGPKEVAMRIVDLLSPVGKGQRGMIVSPPKAGKTTLLKAMASSILVNQPDMHIIIMLIDERPEEVTDIKEAIVGDNVEVLYSTFDELPDHHRRVAEMGIERAKRLVEYGNDVTILLDSITRLARAYNLIVAPSGRTLSGGLDPAALHMPKRFFGAARNMREGGSLTILATALVDTGSKMDDVVYEEFKGTGNMELVLDRRLSERRVFPAIDIVKSGTRREDLLLDGAEMEAVYIMRRALNGMRSDEAVENILNMFAHTRSNAELVDRIRRTRMIG